MDGMVDGHQSSRSGSRANGLDVVPEMSSIFKGVADMFDLVANLLDWWNQCPGTWGLLARLLNRKGFEHFLEAS